MNNEELKERNIQTVLEKTIECFDAYGIEPTTITMVAKKSGVTARSIQRYFHSKDNLVLHALKLFLKQSYHQVKAEYESKTQTVKNGLEEFELCLYMMKYYLTENFKDLTQINEMEFYLIRRGVDSTTINEYFRSTFFIRLLVRNAIERGMQDGSIGAKEDAEVLTDTILGAYVGLMQRIDTQVHCQTQNSKKTADQQIALFEKIIMAYLKE